MSDNNGLFSAKSKAVLQAARMAARNLGSDSITVEHLLLGLVREGFGLCGRSAESFEGEPHGFGRDGSAGPYQ